MIGRWILFDLCNSILHVRYSDGGGGRLFVDKLLEVLDLRAQCAVGSVVEHNEQLQRRVISLRWNPIDHLVALFPLIDHHIVTADAGYVLSLMRLDSDHHVGRISLRWRLLSPRCTLCHDPKYQCNCGCEETLVAHVASCSALRIHNAVWKL